MDGSKESRIVAELTSPYVLVTGHPLWRLVLSRVDSFHDVETPLVNAMERLIDFVLTA